MVVDGLLMEEVDRELTLELDESTKVKPFIENQALKNINFGEVRCEKTIMSSHET